MAAVYQRTALCYLGLMVILKNQWRFAERRPGEPIRGGVNAYAFKINLDTLVRESVQNINDQRVGDRVHAEFVLQTCEGAELRKLLKLVGWNEGLSDHLEAIADARNHISPRARRALKSVDRGSVRVLTIRDFGAKGLGGPEDGEDGNFVQLCRHELVTDESSKKVRGGSFGIGKSVLWAFSDASTVLFSSMPVPEKGKKVKLEDSRFFGRSYLVSHKLGSQSAGKWHQGDGHLGELRKEAAGIEWTVSIRGQTAVDCVGDTALERDWKTTGTSIMVPFFDDPGLEVEQSDEAVIEGISHAIQLWFWPSLAEGFLAARVGLRVKNRETLKDVALPSWANLHVRALNEGIGREKVVDDGGSAQGKLTIEVKKRVQEPKLARFNANALLAVTRLTDEESDDSRIPNEVRNSVALIRGARMVVEYFRRTLPGLLPDFVGVVKAGEALGSTPSDIALDALLRDSEPPAHDRWDPSFEKVRNHYERGAKAELQTFLESIGQRSRDLLGMKSVDSGQKPRELAEMLSGGKSGGRSERNETFEVSSKDIDRKDSTKVTAHLTVKRNKGNVRWKSAIRVGILDEQGTFRALELDPKTVVLLGAKGVTSLISASDSRTLEVTCEAGTSSFEVKCDGIIGGSTTAQRSMADVHVKSGLVR